MGMGWGNAQYMGKSPTKGFLWNTDVWLVISTREPWVMQPSRTSFFSTIYGWASDSYVHAYLCFLLFISTDDASRVILSVPDSDGSDYINASFINVRRHAFNFFNIPASEVQSTRVCLTYNITIDILSCLHVTNCLVSALMCLLLLLGLPSEICLHCFTRWIILRNVPQLSYSVIYCCCFCILLQWCRS